MKHIKLFESPYPYFGDKEVDNDSSLGMENDNPKIYCITGNKGSAVGILNPSQAEWLANYVEREPGKLRIQTFPLKGDEYLKSFMVLTGEGDWIFIRYQSEHYKCKDRESEVFPILKNTLFISFNGSPKHFIMESTIGYAIGSLSKGSHYV